MASNKWPPKFVDESAYENWKKDIGIWCELTELKKEKQALAIHLSLDGRARQASSELDLGVLKKDDGVDKLLEKLDGLFLVDKGRRQFAAFQDLYHLRRSSDMEVRKFVSVFEHTYFKFTSQGMSLPDPVMAFMLLASCRLGDSEQQLVMSAISDVSYSNMKGALNRIFAGEMSAQLESTPVGPGCGVKSEPVFMGEEMKGQSEGVVKEEEALYVSGFQRGRSGFRGGRRGRQSTRARGHLRSSTRRQNPLGPDGRVTRCMICDSRFHWVRNCPDAYENNGNRGGSGAVGGSLEGDTETAYLSLFLGYAGEGDTDVKLSRLVREAKGCAVLDSGCSTTVCGTGWFNVFLSSLSDYERDKIVEDKSTSTFTFADGVTVPSIKRVTLPCSIGNISARIVTDVVDCNIPLLLSRRSMKKAEMLVNFATDQVKIQGRVIDLQTSTSGHYLLPISA